MARLRQLSNIEGHQFWADTISLRDPALFDCSRAGHRQLTDVYLLGLAQKKGGTFATFDRTIPLAAIIGVRQELLEVIAPLEDILLHSGLSRIAVQGLECVPRVCFPSLSRSR